MGLLQGAAWTETWKSQLLLQHSAQPCTSLTKGAKPKGAAGEQGNQAAVTAAQPEVPAPLLLKGRTGGSCGCYQLTPSDSRALSPLEQGKALSYVQLHAGNRQDVLG